MTKEIKILFGQRKDKDTSLYWINKKLESILISTLKHGHLVNIIRMINRKSAEGMSFQIDGRLTKIYGDQVKNYYNYWTLINEANKRNLVLTQRK